MIYVNDGLTDIRNKLTELEDRLRRNNTRIDGIAEEPGKTWEECERKIHRLLSEELDINDVVKEPAIIVKASREEKQQEIKIKDNSL